MNYKDLPEDVKERLRDEHRYVNVDLLDWYEGVYDWAKEEAAKFGLDIENIYFSGFSSQGDGASFEGYLEFKECDADTLPEDVRDVYRELFVKDILMRIAGGEGLRASITQEGRYVHEMSMRFEFDNEVYDALSYAEAVGGLLCDYARWIYRTLEKNYEYLTSDEAIDEYLNDQDYNEQGEVQ